jgi:hypothetical protein
VGGPLRVAGLVVLVLAIANGLRGTDDEDPNLIAVLEVPDQGAARSEDLVVGVRRNGQHPPPPMEGTDRLSSMLGELGKEGVRNGRVVVESKITQRNLATRESHGHAL